MTTPQDPATPAPAGRHRGAIGNGVKLGVAALVVAALGFLVAIAVTAASDEQSESVTPETAEAGQCVDFTETAGRLDLSETDCGRAHDAEIVLTTRVGDAIGEEAELDDAEGVCRGLMADDDLALIDEADQDLRWGLLIDEPSNIDTTDRLVCYVGAAEGRLEVELLG